MAHFRSILSRTSAGFLAGCLMLIGSISATDISEDVLENELRSVKGQWLLNQRDYAQEQERLHRQANSIRSTLCKAGKQQYCTSGVDLRKLAHAVAIAETSGCTAGVGISKNNCHGITECRNGKCGFKTYESVEDSYADFQAMWLRAYGNRFPTMADARRYTDNPDPSRWYGVVTMIYNKN